MRKWLRTSGNYLKWHYSSALFSTFSFWENIFLFLFNYFSIRNLSANFFLPYRKVVSSSKIKNSLAILLGIILRSVIIAIGILVCAIYILLLPLSLIIWLILPILVAWLIISGMILILFA